MASAAVENKRFSLGLFIAIAVLVCCPVAWLTNLPKMALTWFQSVYASNSPREIQPGRARLILLRHALYAYADRYGVLPYDERGPGYALYQLKPFLDNTDGVFEIGLDNENTVTIVDAPLYLNRPNISLDTSHPRLIVLHDVSRRLVCTLDGSIVAVDSTDITIGNVCP